LIVHSFQAIQPGIFLQAFKFSAMFPILSLFRMLECLLWSSIVSPNCGIKNLICAWCCFSSPPPQSTGTAKKMYTHFNRYHLLKCLHFLGGPCILWARLRHCKTKLLSKWCFAVFILC
jgi:hypothetical protein